MKILMITSALDLKEHPAGTMVWWQLLKGLSEIGVEVVAVPFIGKPVETPWWRCYKNPTEASSKQLYFLARKLSSVKNTKKLYGNAGGFSTRALNGMFLPSWHRFISSIMKKEKDIDAVVFCSIPINLLQTLASKIENEWGVKSIYYEIDMPDILPSHGGFHFSYYVGTDLSEYSLFLSNSAGVENYLKELGARHVDTLFFGADPEIYRPVQTNKNTDVFFSGFGSKFRENWIEKMLIKPSLQDPRVDFCVSGKNFAFNQSNMRFLGYLSFGSWKTQCCASRINLNISRKPHAETMLSSTLRIFEFCSLGCCVVSNKHLGLDHWFTPGKEIFMLNEEDDPLDMYHFLLDNPAIIEKTGSEARSRILRDHTYRSRAEKLSNLIKCLK